MYMKFLIPELPVNPLASLIPLMLVMFVTAVKQVGSNWETQKYKYKIKDYSWV